ncbi:hypothetical protein F320042A7_48050 [Blautia producta]
MGLILMIILMLLGIAFIVIGIMHKKNNIRYQIVAIIGIILILLSIYLGFPK